MAPLKLEEYRHLVKELQTWMRNEKYQMQGSDRIPIWRATNSSLTIATGAAVGSYAAIYQFRPNWKFPQIVIRTGIVFFVVFNVAQASQTFSVIDSHLKLTSPLGVAARDILTNFRNSGNVSSQATSKMGFHNSAVSRGLFDKEHISHGNTFGSLEEDEGQKFHADDRGLVLTQRGVDPNPVTAEPEPSEPWDPNTGFSWSNENMHQQPNAQKKRSSWQEIRDQHKKKEPE